MAMVTKLAPDFTADAVMPDNTFAKISLSDYRGKYVVLFFYPMDFTFVCPTELIAFDRQFEAFKKLNAEVIAVSVDSVYSHFAWKSMEPKEGGIGNVKYPIVGDISKKISRDYDVLLDDSVALRGLFLIDKGGVIRHQVVNDLPLGRNIGEALRMVEALRFFEEHGDVCPANWQQGEDGVVADARGIADYLAKH
ncbi:peroxiredoxin [Victivallis sp. Marseille-Q1083]|uniref:peroxiredoxin n=1 Tax=Victivallis sp. Marseille-Q1083 TaxID=2717288 RepID=UPI001588A58D|nr:peroxiredoxin [Victivallis sp. Marseille-Q1083]